MKKQTGASSKVSGKYFLPVVLLIYLFFYLSAPEAAGEALLKSIHILLKLLPVLLVVIVLLGIFNYFFKPRAIAKHLGVESGARGWVIAVVGGILSHGPSYVWYQMLSDLRNHGAKDGLIVTFIYVRAIKLPWLPVMIDYFGWLFTIVVSLVLIVAGVVQGMIMERLDRR
ncbi:MAG: permease [Campylobacterota bacterium]|nr:permease [Campylobacterota bacterium]